MPSAEILLGYEVGTGEPVHVPVHHTVVTGQSQNAGKTTTLEAMIDRSGLQAVTFVTKRGEGAFATGHRINPYFQESGDWQLVESIIASTMNQKMRFERAWIIRAAKGAKTLADVHANVRKLRRDAKGMSADVYLLLDEYLKLVVPLIAQLPKSDRVRLTPGLNVMDLSPYPSQLQALVIRSVLEWVYKHEVGTLTVIPESWEFIPESRGSPVKLAAAQLIRKGAALRNFVWVDSQDIAGVDKEIIKQVSLWVLGVQREINELKRTLAHIPAGVKKPKPDEIAGLKKGQFYACWSDRTVKVYVQPTWLSAEEAVACALGKKLPEPPTKVVTQHTPPTEPVAEAVVADTQDWSLLHAKLDQMRDLIQRRPPLGATSDATTHASPSAVAPFDVDVLYAEIKRRLVEEEPALLKVLLTKPAIEVTIRRQTIEADGESVRGRLALLISEGFFDGGVTGTTVNNELGRRGKRASVGGLYTELDNLARMGFLTIEPGAHKKDGKKYKAMAGAQDRITTKETE